MFFSIMLMPMTRDLRKFKDLKLDLLQRFVTVLIHGDSIQKKAVCQVFFMVRDEIHDITLTKIMNRLGVSDIFHYLK